MHDPYDGDYDTDHDYGTEELTELLKDDYTTDQEQEAGNIKRVRLAEPDQPALHLPADIQSLIISYACHPLGRRAHQRTWSRIFITRWFEPDFPNFDWAVFYLCRHPNGDSAFKKFTGPRNLLDYDAYATVAYDTEVEELFRPINIYELL